MRDPDRPPRPSELDASLPWFDRFAGRCSSLVARAPFFSGCMLLVVLWLPTLFVLPLNTSQLVIQTLTAIITFLLIALLQNSQARSDAATQHKLNEISDALSNVIEALHFDDRRLDEDVRELRAAVGLEQRERS